eukprot:scaffold1244_cov162-Ochromonas_danica.AAC.12
MHPLDCVALRKSFHERRNGRQGQVQPHKLQAGARADRPGSALRELVSAALEARLGYTHVHRNVSPDTISQYCFSQRLGALAERKQVLEDVQVAEDEIEEIVFEQREPVLSPPFAVRFTT